MYAKVEITGMMDIITGLHIGGSNAFAPIGAVDSPVVKDPISRQPMIPGSSLKGKMRTLLAKKYNTGIVEPDQDEECLRRLFGCAKKGHVKVSRVLFSDMFLANGNELKEKGLIGATEIKFENNIQRTTSVANPRQIERIVRGAQFPVKLLYECSNDADMKEDISLLCEGFKLLEYDYLGGNGSRGYGRVQFCDMELDVVLGELDDYIVDECRQLLSEV